MTRLAILCLPLMLFLVGCDNDAIIQHNGKTMHVSIDKKEEQRYKLNPNPQKKYRLTINIENAPGDFTKLKTSAHYQVTDSKCKYVRAGIASSTGQPDFSIPLKPFKISDSQYQIEFYLDGMLDENYYGTGICEWKLQNVSAVFLATGAKTDTGFSAGILDTDLDKKIIETNHRKAYYPIYEDRPGSISRGLIKERALPEDYFTFYTTIEEI